jgi:hypothetical protein
MGKSCTGGVAPSVMLHMKLLFYIIISLSFTVSAQDWLEDTVELTGNVKHVHYTRTIFISENKEDWWTMDNNYFYSSSGFLMRSTISGNADGKFEYGTLRVFNRSGDKCLEEYKINEGDTTSKRVFICDSLNRVTKSIYYSNDELWSANYFKYNYTGQVSEKLAITVRNDSLWDKYEYDSQQRMTKYIDSSKSSCSIKTWSFDSKDRLIELKSQKLKSPKPIVVKLGANGEILDQKKVDRLPKDDDHSIVAYYYNDLDQVTKEVLKYIDSEEGKEINYTYNEQGDISITITIDTKPGEESKTSITYSYEYDSNGNWITKSYYWNGELDERETREIEYY